MNNVTRVHYVGTGHFLVHNGRQKLCRYSGDTLFFWAVGGHGGEISMTMSDLQAMIAEPPTVTAAERAGNGYRNLTR